MISFERYVLGTGWLILGCIAAFAAPPLTTVQDVLFNANGTTFNGLVTISWPSFVASDMSNIAAHSISTQVINGLLRVQLVPTTTALSLASYTVVYSGGNTQFTENWAVPDSNVPVPVATVRISGSGAVVRGGGGPLALTTINIADVSGLTAALAIRPTMGAGYIPSRASVIDASGALDGAVGNLPDCVHVDGTSGPCGAGGTPPPTLTFVDSEAPAGLINGINGSFTVANPPSPALSLSLFRNGLMLRQGLDYSLSNTAIVFLGSIVPQLNDVLLASYRLAGTVTGLTFYDGETPGGAVNGLNSTFSLSQIPNPAASLALFRNGVRLKANLDFTIAGSGIVFFPGTLPQPGDILVASYRVGF